MNWLTTGEVQNMQTGNRITRTIAFERREEDFKEFRSGTSR